MTKYTHIVDICDKCKTDSYLMDLNGNWWKYEYVCPNCDAYIEYTVDISEVSPAFMLNLPCVCGGTAVKMSEHDAIIGQLSNRKEYNAKLGI